MALPYQYFYLDEDEGYDYQKGRRSATPAIHNFIDHVVRHAMRIKRDMHITFYNTTLKDYDLNAPSSRSRNSKSKEERG